MKVNVINKSINDLPTYAKPGDSGMDVRADFSRITETNLLELKSGFLPKSK